VSSDDLWRQMVDAERSYYAARMELFRRGDNVKQLRAALASGKAVTPALRALKGAPRADIEALLDEIFPRAIDFQDKTPAGVELLAELDPEWLRSRLPVLINRFLAQPQLDYYEYRLLANALQRLGQTESIQLLIEHAAASDDPEVLEELEDLRDRYAKRRRHES
jgi:hypothetical protein